MVKTLSFGSQPAAAPSITTMKPLTAPPSVLKDTTDGVHPSPTVATGLKSGIGSQFLQPVNNGDLLQTIVEHQVIAGPSGASTPMSVPSINIRDTTAVQSYGLKPQEAIGRYADTILSNVRTSNMDVVGPKLVEIVEIAKELDPKDLTSPTNLPFIGGLIKRFVKSKDRFVAKFNTLSSQIDKVVGEIDRTQVLLTDRNVMLEDLYVQNMAEYNALVALIEEGDKIIALELQRFEIAKGQLPPNPTPIQTQELADWKQAIQRFEKRIGDLRAIQMLCVQTMPEIRLIQQNNMMLVEKFNNAKNLTIPTWKKQFVLAIALDEQKKAAALSKTIDDATNEFARRNADLLNQNSVIVAQQNQRAVIDTETLEYCNKQLIDTFAEITKIETEGAQKRAASVGKFEVMKAELHKATVDFVANRIR